MFYRKNIYTWEAIARIALSAVAALYALLEMPTGLPSMAIIVMAAVFALTGVFGWCPACAMVGRKIKRDLNE